MDAENLIVASLIADNGGKWQIREERVNLLKRAVWIIDIFSKSFCAFSSEAEMLVDIGVLVVSSEQENVVWVPDLQSHQETNNLKRKLATIHVIAKKHVGKVFNVTLVRRTLPDIKESHHIDEVPVDVAKNFNRSFDIVNNDRLRENGHGGLACQLDDIVGFEHKLGSIRVILVLLGLHEVLEEHESEGFVWISDVIGVLAFEAWRQFLALILKFVYRNLTDEH